MEHGSPAPRAQHPEKGDHDGNSVSAHRIAAKGSDEFSKSHSRRNDLRLDNAVTSISLLLITKRRPQFTPQELGCSTEDLSEITGKLRFRRGVDQA